MEDVRCWALVDNCRVDGLVVALPTRRKVGLASWVWVQNWGECPLRDRQRAASFCSRSAPRRAARASRAASAILFASLWVGSPAPRWLVLGEYANANDNEGASRESEMENAVDFESFFFLGWKPRVGR